jgi:hypothetical protein
MKKAKLKIFPKNTIEIPGEVFWWYRQEIDRMSQVQAPATRIPAHSRRTASQREIC